MKHNISITVDAKLFRELENIRGREKRSTFIEHLIVIGLNNYANKKGDSAAQRMSHRLALAPSSSIGEAGLPKP
jgi:metal-responsive CopG/Arc/MetJ family transcriptional regulator